MPTVLRDGMIAVHRAQLEKKAAQGYTPEEVAREWSYELEAVLRFWPTAEKKADKIEEDL